MSVITTLRSCVRRVRVGLPVGARTVVTHGVIALALLFGQQHAVRHELGHAIESIAKHGGAPSSAACDECIAVAALGAANIGACFAFDLPAHAHAQIIAPPAASHVARARASYRSRAPPPSFA